MWYNHNNMSEEQEAKGIEGGAAVKKKPNRAVKVLKYTGIGVLLAILALLVVNAMLSVFMPHYYPTFGGYRLISIISDSMEPTIPTGHMIVVKKPESEEKDNIQAGAVITFEIADEDGNIQLFTHRVVAVTKNPNTGETSYITKGDNKKITTNDKFRPDYSDVVGIYTGRHCAFFGYLFGFLQSTWGAILLILILFVIVVAWIVMAYVKRNEKRKQLENAALKKSAHELSNVNLRYDNIREITAVMDVLSMVTEEPKSRAESKDIQMRLGEFIDAESIELPQTPETAAVLDSLPAPDTPMTLAAALRNGATLRQAEDGQTLVLTGMSGGKSILLTPVQTPDGIILCQQGVRLRSDLAPNIESVGAMSMPEYPEFFEGQPLEKNVEYPELPQPQQKFGPQELVGGASEEPSDILHAPALSAPTPVGQAHVAALDMAKRNETVSPALSSGAAVRIAEARSAYAQYREVAASIELRQTEELSTLLTSAEPLSPEEKARLAEYKEELKRRKAAEKGNKPKKSLTPEQLAARREAAQRRKDEQEAFIGALDPADRELYLSEQKLSKTRAATIRRLKRINSDRKLLEKIK